MAFILLTDAPEWCGPLRAALERVGVPVEVVDARCLGWTPSTPLPTTWRVVFNRLSARPSPSPEHGLPTTQAAVTKYRDLLQALDLKRQVTGTPAIVNGSACHHVGLSKAVQAALLASLGVRTPETRLVGSVPEVVAAGDGDEGSQWLVKPNVGGRGAGIVAPTNSRGGGSGTDYAVTFEADGAAVLQRVVPRPQPQPDGGSTEEPRCSAKCVHRVEVLGGKPLYAAHVAIDDSEEQSFNNCLSDVCVRPPRASKAASKIPPLSFSKPSDIPESIVADAVRVARAASMDVGSVEYLLDADGNASFIDINPVSTMHPGAAEVMPSSQLPIDAQAAFLADLWKEASRLRN